MSTEEPPKSTSSPTPSKPGEILNNATENAQETSCLKDMRLAILVSMCHADLEKS